MGHECLCRAEHKEKENIYFILLIVSKSSFSNSGSLTLQLGGLKLKIECVINCMWAAVFSVYASCQNVEYEGKITF